VTLDIATLSNWIGKTEIMQEQLSPELVGRFNATLGSDFSVAVGEPAPLLIHLCLAQPALPADQLGEDGHPRRGGFLPPVPLPRRMWAGGEMIFLGPLPVGAQVKRQSTIRNIEEKQGHSGRLCFVTVQHDISADGTPAVREQQHIVYRDPPASAGVTPDTAAPAAPAALAAHGTHVRQVTPSPTMLFRYSALTFNGHRIHYDAPYARDIEGYDGLVVHGPMQATIMAQMAADLYGRPPTTFRYRGKSPLFCDQTFTINATSSDTGMSLWTARLNGPVAMQAEAIWDN